MPRRAMFLPTVPVRAACGCAEVRTLPLRLVSDALARLRREAGGKLDPDEPVLTYRCRHCKQVIVLRAQQLYLAGPYTGTSVG